MCGTEQSSQDPLTSVDVALLGGLIPVWTAVGLDGSYIEVRGRNEASGCQKILFFKPDAETLGMLVEGRGTHLICELSSMWAVHQRNSIWNDKN